jgi:thioredoxin reductase
MAHGVFTRDGSSPEELLRIGREQLRPYETVSLRSEAAIQARPVEDRIEVTLANGETVRCRRLLLAHGLVDELPHIEGLQDLWGKSIFHCPYCDGWEVRDEPLVACGSGEAALEYVQVLLGWSKRLTLCTEGPPGLTEAQLGQFERHGIPIHEASVRRVDGANGRLEHVILSDGTELQATAMFMHPPYRLSADLATQLGCELTEKGLIVTDEWGRTSVNGVFAAGDIMTPNHQVIRAAATGSTAAIRLNGDLLAEDFV